jgi:pimeloyl-ACP methyl ester carboxylesterase
MSSIYKSANGQVTVQAAYDRLLSQLPAEIEQHNVATSQGSTFVLAAGKRDAPPIVFFHGSLSNSITWGGELVRLAPNFRVYAIDMIGEAGKSAEARPSLHSTAYSLWLQELFQALGIVQPILVGLSLGGWLALTYATHFPANVKGLILISPGGVGQNRNVLLWALPYFLLGKWGVKRFYRKVLGPLGTELEGSEMSDFLQAIATHVKPRTEALPIVGDQQLAALSCPVLLLIGGKDIMLYPEEIRARLKRHVRHYEEVYVAEAGHYLGDQSVVIDRFLTSLVVAG